MTRNSARKLPEIFKEGDGIPFWVMNDICSMLNNLRGENGMEFFRQGNSLVCRLVSAPPVDYTVYTNGFQILPLAGGTVLLTNIELHHGDQRHTIGDESGAVPSGAGIYYIGLAYQPDTQILSFLSPSTDVSLFVSDANEFRIWTAAFERRSEEDGGALVLHQIGHLGIIILDAMFGPRN